jgi:hypothetical protein
MDIILTLNIFFGLQFVVAAGVASVLTYFSLGHGDNEGDTEALVRVDSMSLSLYL